MGEETEKETEKVEQCKCTEKEEKEIFQEMLCDVNNCLNYYNNPCNNQQLIGHKDF